MSIQSEEESKRFIRLNVQLDGEPKLDDLSKILEMLIAAKGYSSAAMALTRNYMYSTSFYFEHDEIPLLDADVYHCSRKLKTVL